MINAHRSISSQLGVATRSATSKLTYSRDESDSFRQEVQLLVSKTEKERKIALDGLQPLFSDWQVAKVMPSAAYDPLHYNTLRLRDLLVQHVLSLLFTNNMPVSVESLSAKYRTLLDNTLLLAKYHWAKCQAKAKLLRSHSLNHSNGSDSFYPLKGCAEASTILCPSVYNLDLESFWAFICFIGTSM